MIWVKPELVGTLLGTVFALLPAAAALGNDGDPVRGERVFQRCYSCHSVAPNETAQLQGPTLFRILDRPAAAIAGFDYSEAMREKAAAGLVWDAPSLDRYIADPDSLVPRTRMSIPPLRNEQDRADLIAYLALSGRHVPLVQP